MALLDLLALHSFTYFMVADFKDYIKKNRRVSLPIEALKIIWWFWLMFPFLISLLYKTFLN